jgi:dTDP-4-dehydrorhamnose reductase
VDSRHETPPGRSKLAGEHAIRHTRPEEGQCESPEHWSGTYHLSAAGQTTWFNFARAILALDPRREEQVCRCVTAIGTHEYPTPVPRPHFAVLDTARG